MCLPQDGPRRDSSERRFDCKDVTDKDDTDNYNDDSVIALLPNSQRSNETPSSASDAATPKRLRLALVVLLAGVGAIWLVSAAGSLTHVLPTSSNSRARSSPVAQETILNELGWLGTMDNLRHELVAADHNLKKHFKEQTALKATHVNVTEFCDLIDYALDVVGVRGVFFELFNNAKNFIPKDKKCVKKGHGVGCGIEDIWWLQHYVGATTAEKLLRDGSLLLDPITGERINNAKAFMTELHHMQEQLYTAKMSFHAQHAFIWHYLTATMPDLDAYPIELANDFCGDYTYNNKKAKSAHKLIGSECYHGFGHGVFMVLAIRQTKGWDNFTARKQFRPGGEFVPTHETVCAGFEICRSAPTDTDAPLHFCHGGIRHSYRLLNKKWINNAEELDALFEAQRKMCEAEAGIEVQN